MNGPAIVPGAPHQKCHRDHEDAADDQRGDPGAQHARRIAAAGRARPHGRRLAEAERHHEGHSRALQRDLVRRQLSRADQPDQEARAREQANLHDQRHADRQAKPEDLAKARPVQSPEAAV